MVVWAVALSPPGSNAKARPATSARSKAPATPATASRCLAMVSVSSSFTRLHQEGRATTECGRGVRVAEVLGGPHVTPAAATGAARPDAAFGLGHSAESGCRLLR